MESDSSFYLLKKNVIVVSFIVWVSTFYKLQRNCVCLFFFFCLGIFLDAAISKFYNPLIKQVLSSILNRDNLQKLGVGKVIL